MPQITSEYLQERGKAFEKAVIAQAPAELRVKGLSIEGRLNGVSTEELVSDMSDARKAELIQLLGAKKDDVS